MKKLYIKQKVFKITDHYPVLDENQDIVYQVDEEFKFIGKKIRVSDKEGNPVFTINREVLTLLPHFVIDFADGTTLELKSRFTFLKKKIDVLPEESDIHVEGSFFSYRFEVHKSGVPIGEIERGMLTWGDVFEITVLQEEYQELLLAIMLAVDAILDAEANAAS